MTARTRYFVITSLLLMIVGVGTGLVAYYVGFPAKAFSSRGGPDELKYLPRDATIVAYADVGAVMASDLRQHVRSALPAQENGQREFENETGINIETDIDRVVFCLDGSPALDGSSAALVLATGRFDEVKIESLMREHGATVEQYKGKRLIVAMPRAPSTDPSNAPPNEQRAPAGRDARVRKGGDFAVSFLKPGLASVGSANLIRTAIDLENGGESVTTNETLMNLIRSMDSGNAWAVGRFDALRSKARLPEGMNQLPAITWFSVGGHVNGGFNGVVRAETRDDESANNLRDVVRGFMAIAKLQAASKPELRALMQSLELGGAGHTVALSFSVPAQAFDLIGPAGGNKGERPRAR